VVALNLRNRVEFVVLLFARWRLGATVTPVNPSVTDAEVMRQLAACGARLLVVEDGVSAPDGVATLAVGNLYAKGAGLRWATAGGSGDACAADLRQRHHRVPKGVMLDHANLDAWPRWVASLWASGRRIGVY
jgi:long-chain acyl-CoA synthetase